MYDPALRRGITLSINSSAGGYQSQGTDRHVHFGIDNAHRLDWQDCGHPNPSSNYVSNSLTVYKGKLYAATAGGKDEKDWRHVYRYEGGQKWIDCGQVGDGKVEGVGPLIVHNGDLYAVTTTIDWTRVTHGGYDPGRVYRYLGGTQWEDCGQPSENRTLNCIASYKGKLYVGGGPESYGVFVREADSTSGNHPRCSNRGNCRRGCFPHAMCRHNGKLFVAYPGAYAFDGNEWTFAGETLPAGSKLVSSDAYHGNLSRKASRGNMARRQSDGLSRRRNVDGNGPRGRGRHGGAIACCLQRQTLRRFAASRRGLSV